MFLMKYQYVKIAFKIDRKIQLRSVFSASGPKNLKSAYRKTYLLHMNSLVQNLEKKSA